MKTTMTSVLPIRQEQTFHRLLYAAVIAILVCLAAFRFSPSAQAAQQTSATVALTKHYFTYGMTKKQVQRVVGRPKVIRGSFWYYPVIHGKIAGKVPVVADGTNIVLPADQFRIFFYGGHLQGESAHINLP